MTGDTIKFAEYVEANLKLNAIRFAYHFGHC